MPAVDADYAARLQADALYVSASPAGAVAWAERAVEATSVSPLALAADATTEAQREANFLGGPTVVDRHIVSGHRRDVLFRSVTITGDRYGYQGGVLCFVIGIAENANNTTTLTVLRKLT